MPLDWKDRLPLPVRTRARRLRRDLTDPERQLWYRLRARRLEGYRFRRQHPIGRYVVDFVCEEARLVIEVDGGQHNEEDAKRRDADRSRFIESQGYVVRRYWNDSVLFELENVLEDVLRVVRERISRIPDSGRGESDATE